MLSRYAPLAAVVLAASVSGCGDTRSAAAVCDVWDRDGLALHDSFEQTGTSSDDPVSGLFALVGAPGRIGSLMNRMAAVAPPEIEPSFTALGEAFKAIAPDVSANPLTGLGNSLMVAAGAQDDVAAVNEYLGTNCGIPGDGHA